MNFIITIVYKNGKIRRFLLADYCDFSYDSDSIIIYCNKYTEQYAIKKADIASVVFYP